METKDYEKSLAEKMKKSCTYDKARIETLEGTVGDYHKMMVEWRKSVEKSMKDIVDSGVLGKYTTDIEEMFGERKWVSEKNQMIGICYACQALYLNPFDVLKRSYSSDYERLSVVMFRVLEDTSEISYNQGLLLQMTVLPRIPVHHAIHESEDPNEVVEYPPEEIIPKNEQEEYYNKFRP